MKQYKKLAINTFFFALGNIGSKSINFLMLPIFTRYIAPSNYGKLDIINTTVSLLVPILSFQIIEAIFRFAIEFRSKNKNIVLSTAIFLSFISLGFSLILYPILKNISVFNQYTTYFYIIFYLTVLNGIIKQYIRGLEKIKLYVLSDFLYTIVFAISNVFFLVLMRLGIEAYLLSNIFALLFSSLFIIFSAGLHKEISLNVDKKLLKEMLSYSIPLIPNGIMWWIVVSSDRYIITYFIGYEATGIYSVAARFPSLLTLLFGIFFQAWQLSAMEEYDRENYDIFFEKVFGAFSSVMFLSTSVLFLIIKPFMNVFVGKAYIDSLKYIPFLFLGAVFQTFASFYGVNYTASKKTIGAFSTSIIAAIVKIASIFSFINILKLQAAAVSTFLAYFFMWIARIFHTKKLVKIKLDKKHLVWSSSLLIIQSLVLLVVKNILIEYVIQGIILIIIILLQWKYIKLLLKFGTNLIGEKISNSKA